MIIIKTLKYKTFDQALTALITYVPLCLPLYQRDLNSVAQVSTFLMIYSLILGLIRSTFVNIIYSQKSQKLVSLKLVKTAIGVYAIPLFMGTSIYLSVSSFNFWILPLCASIFLSGIQEIFRQLLLKFRRVKEAFLTDAIWLVSIVFTMPIVNAYSNSTFIIATISWTIGLLNSLIIQFLCLQTMQIFESKRNSRWELATFLKFGLISVISSSHGLAINLIFVLQNMNQELGIYRGILTFFLPISFIINYQQIVLLPILSEKMNPNRENSELSTIAILLFPVLCYISVVWVLQDLTLYNCIIGIATGVTPIIVLFSSRIHLNLVVYEQVDSYLKLRIAWFFVSCLTVAITTFTHSLLLVLILLSMIEVLFLVVSKYVVRNKFK